MWPKEMWREGMGVHYLTKEDEEGYDVEHR